MNGFSRLRCGVKNISNASRSAAAGATASSRRIPVETNRPVVLLLNRTILAGVMVPPSSLAGCGVFQQARVGAARPLLGARIAQKAMQMVEAEIDPERVERELIDVEIAAEVSLFYADVRGPGQRLQQLLLLGNHEVADRAVAIVDFRGRGDEDAPAGQAGHPPPPVLEERLQPGQAARLPEGRRHDLVDELAGSDPQHLELQLFLGVEVGEEAALGEAQLARQRGQAQPVEPLPGSEAEGGVEDALASLGALAHGS